MPFSLTEEPAEKLLDELIALSADWEAENSCYGYRKNGPEDILGSRVFLARQGETIVGYLFGHGSEAEKTSSIIEAGTKYFEIEELYVRPAFRSQGVGKALFQFTEKKLRREGEAKMMMLSTATKNWKAILHFYLDELDMNFWSARLFKTL